MRISGVVATLSLAASIALPQSRSFSGEIMDSQCAELGAHGVVNPLKTTRDCTIECVRFGGQYVLYSSTMQMAYGLDDQRRPELFAGGRVEVTGTLNPLTHTIHVLEIRAAGE